MPFSIYIQPLINRLNNQSIQVSISNMQSSSTLSCIKLKNTSCLLNHNNYRPQKRLLIAADAVYRFSNLESNNFNLFKELIEKYWQQRIFLSNSTRVSQKYIALLAKQEGINAKTAKKHLILAFSKALQEGYVQAHTFSRTHLLSESKNTTYIQYMWNKGFNLNFANSWKNLFINKRSDKLSVQQQKILINKLKQNNVPIFFVANGFKQMVLAEPPNQLLSNKNYFNNLFQLYYDIFLWNKDYGGVYEGWFFVNPKDAEEYKNAIEVKYKRSYSQNGLQIVPARFDFYYKLNRLSPPRTEFRLMPDLKEVGKLVKQRSYRQNLVFDKKQKYGKSFFQGQPIYLIDPIKCQNIKTRKVQMCSYYFPNTEKTNKPVPIFFSKDIAMKAWDHFRTDQKQYKLPKYPLLRVYNLEDFLIDYENATQKNDQDFLFIPNRDAYQLVKQEYLKNNNAKQLNNDLSSIKICRIWMQRLLSSLTSRQPPNW
uniref:Ycf80 n=1 Tax=Dichotomaria marginata TaxID=268567 RepID=A0A1G4NS77_9FLOR|nr:Hypothetical protein ORF_2 [Dichotomaria marginata]SCW21518.1 Hypothetical protein ORF_2 [Dichotomaria marginata]